MASAGADHAQPELCPILSCFQDDETDNTPPTYRTLTRRVMARMMGGTRLPPIPYLLSNMVTKKAPRKPPDDERDIKRDDELGDLPPEVRREEVWQS